ncbi:hypothetical protein SAMN04490206_4354 [Pseudomonas umsongensis]|nr:hypothetical protein SAMN04490206_4354 [Pseudomonas umsongensis]
MASRVMKITLKRIALFQFSPAHCAQAERLGQKVASNMALR